MLLAAAAAIMPGAVPAICTATGPGSPSGLAGREVLWVCHRSRRANHEGEPGPVAVQIAGTEPVMMAEAAAYNIDRGAQIIDINMGCPAKKVCNKWAGSALMRDEPLALAIAAAVVQSCAPHGVPVTLKMRTGWSQAHRNAVRLARAFEDAGVQMLTVHGRTREQGYGGVAEYETIAAVKDAVRVPVVANGAITTPEQVLHVLCSTGADAIMIGRAAQGRPWIFREVAHFLATGRHLAPPLVAEVRGLLLEHLQDHYALYGEHTGVRSARKHIAWYVRTLPGGAEFRSRMNAIEDGAQQLEAVGRFFDELGSAIDRMPAGKAGEREEEALEAGA
jgi:tRNA-dihydrouridine synthase B